MSGWRGTEAAPLTGLWVHGLWGEGEGRVTVASRVSGVVTLDQVLSVSSVTLDKGEREKEKSLS